MQHLGKFDIVCSWGVLHHTGNMNQALDNAILPLANDGLLYITLYSYDLALQNRIISGVPSPEEWLTIKHAYIHAGKCRRHLMEFAYLWQRFGVNKKRTLIEGMKQLAARIHYYKSEPRGMDFWTDIRDWLGGWPMEFAKEHEVQEKMTKHGLELLRIDTGRANTEFLFQAADCTLWNTKKAMRKIIPLQPPFFTAGRGIYEVFLPQLCSQANTAENNFRSRLRLMENGKIFGFANAHLAAMQESGYGRYQHLADTLYFTTPDKSNPNTNGRCYAYFLDTLD